MLVSKSLVRVLGRGRLAVRPVSRSLALRAFSNAPVFRNQTIHSQEDALKDAGVASNDAVKDAVKDAATSNETVKDAVKDAEDIDKPLPETFEELINHPSFNPKLIASLTHMGYEKLTPVQQRSMLPMLKEENGVVVRAKTGTGKTLAFIVPTVQTSIDVDNAAQNRENKIQSIVIAPTRDLAFQIQAAYKSVVARLPGRSRKRIEVELLIGGKKTSLNPRDLPSILVATPGRLKDTLENTRYLASACSDLKYRVYDEADRLLDIGFEEELHQIDRILRDARKDALDPTAPLKSVLFSATVDKSVDSFARNTIARDYKYINCVDENEPEAHENIRQVMVKTKSLYESQLGALSFVLKNLKDNDFKAMLFVPTVSGVEWVYKILQAAKRNNVYDSDVRTSRGGNKNYSRGARSHAIFRLNGKMSQGSRDVAVRNFREAQSGVLICTDVAARGLDFKDVSHVIQYSPSSDVADYIHKVGRTARAGAKGSAILYTCPTEANYVRALQTKRGVTFAEEINYESLAEDEANFRDQTDVQNLELSEFINSLIGYYRSQVSSHRLNLKAVFEDVVGVSRGFLNEPDYKYPTTRRQVEQNIGLPPAIADTLFEVPGGFDLTRQHSKSRFDSPRGNSRGNFRGNSRGNSRGGYNDRSSRSYGDSGSEGGYKKFSNDRNSDSSRGGYSRNNFNDRGGYQERSERSERSNHWEGRGGSRSRDRY